MKLLAILFSIGIFSISFGQFAQKASYQFSGDEITFLTVANIDTDSFPETITTVRKGSLWKLYATKTHSLTPPVLLADSLITSYPPTLMDWNGDRLLDFVFITNAAQNNSLVLLNQGNLIFSKVKVSVGVDPISKVEFKDLTNDESREAIVIKKSGGWSILKQNNNAFEIVYDSAAIIDDFYVFDFDGNGYNDVAFSGTSSSGKSFTNILEFEDSLKIKRYLTLPLAIHGKIESGDLDHDGHFDLIVSGLNPSGQMATQSFLNYDSTFIKGKTYLAISEPKITIADFDSDGKVDLSFTGKSAGGNLLHWMKTFSGDSLSLPTQNITQSTYGDFDRDGDLDLVVATDTLGVVLFENSTLQNLAPSKPTDEIWAFIYNRLFLYWDASSDDHTPVSSLTYDLQLAKSGTEVVDGEFDTTNGLRQTVTHGNTGTNNFHLMKVTTGTYEYAVEGVDNSLYAKRITSGICQGSCTLQEPQTISVCDNKPVKITQPQPVMWFSFSKGYLGKSTSLTANVKTDTIFSFLPKSSNSCNAITLYLLKESKKDTIKVAQNFTGCEGNTLNLKVAAEWKSVAWKDSKGTAKGTGNSLDYTITKNESITGTGKNDHGCFIRQTENIKLSKPVLVLDGTDYKIVFGSSATLGVSGAKEYLWSPATGLDDVTSAHPLASPSETTTYKVIGLDSINCHAEAQLLVEVIHKSFIPNLFTPNGDGKNDDLKIYGLSHAQDFHFSIYNREGALVYEATDLSAVSWDGTKNGTQQPSGLYYWKVQGVLDNGQPIYLNDKSKGSILLVR